MTRSSAKTPSRAARRGRSGDLARGPSSDAWMLQDAKTHFSEVVRRARDFGPQRVSVRGREAVVVVSAREFRALKGEGQSGRLLVEALAASPHRDVEIEPERFRETFRLRDVDL